MSNIERLRKFYAVTLNPTSIFSISDEMDMEGCPIIECIATRNRSNTPAKFRLHGGPLVAITRQGIIMYRDPFFHPAANGPQKPSPIHEVTQAFRGDRTNNVVALMDNLSDAFSCFHALRLECLDDRWEHRTKAVLRAIGEDHNVFTVSRFPPYAFDYENKF